MKQYDIIIVGAGPSGMSAALSASKSGCRILLLEGADRIGKKILVTGNGKCNLTNEKQSFDCYRTKNPEAVQQILEEFSYEDTHIFFQELGILTRKKNGYVYPYNEQAASVRDAFENKIAGNSMITVCTSCKVKDVEPVKKGYLVHTEQGKYMAKSVILTTGGYAGEKIGCDGSGYRFARRLGHKLVKPYPALTPLKSSAPFLKKASGVRNQAKITLLVDGEALNFEQGELQWTDYGISGVAVFQLSRFAILALEAGKKVSLSLNFMPDWQEEALYDMMKNLASFCPDKNMMEFLSGMMPAKLVPIILREARVEMETHVGNIADSQFKNLLHTLQAFELRINGYVGYEKAQVTRGGISFEEMTSSLESIYHPGLFFAGELVDVDGSCGGYNLQWAFSSGNIAGRAAADTLERKRGL